MSSSLWDNTSFVIYAILIAAIVFGRWVCSSGECATVCKSNGHKPEWTWTQGCYCRDAEGLYNPADSRR